MDGMRRILLGNRVAHKTRILQTTTPSAKRSVSEFHHYQHADGQTIQDTTLLTIDQHDGVEHLSDRRISLSVLPGDLRDEISDRYRLMGRREGEYA